MKLPIYELKISESLTDDAEVSYVALVDLPAIKKEPSWETIQRC